MKKFEKAVSVSVLSLGLAGGMLAVGAHVEHVQDEDRLACYTQLDGEERDACLTDVSQSTTTEQLLEIGALAGIIGAVAAGVQAYRSLAKED